MMKLLSLILTIGNIALFVCTGSTTENNITFSESINGETLIKLGRKMNKPMLTFLGMAMQNLHKCEEWTVWTECEAKQLGSFGTRTRTRKCNEEKVCINCGENQTTETDSNLCEGGLEKTVKVTCPSDYNITKSGFCIKLHTIAKANSEADSKCQIEGGYLINIDTDKKYSDAKDILKGGPQDTWVGGRRKETNGAWEFIYGENNEYYKNYWIRGYPGSGVLCLALENFLWFTYDCSYNLPFLCEIA